MRYAVVIEKGLMGFSAYVPDLPGCVAAGSARDDVVREIRRAIEAHIEGLRNNGCPIPAPAFSVELVEVASELEVGGARPASAVNGSRSSARCEAS
jgi:predicted RNase H-like HicB family nuclease